MFARSLPSFHYRKAVAPLKRDRRAHRPAGGLRFHHRKTVAPLKRGQDAAAEVEPEKFPLPKGGGPIEAVIRVVS